MFKTYKKSIEEFDNKFSPLGDLQYKNDGGVHIHVFKHTKAHIKSHTLEMIRGDILRLKVEIGELEDISGMTGHWIAGQKKAIQNEINLKEKHYKLIKKDNEKAT